MQGLVSEGDDKEYSRSLARTLLEQPSSGALSPSDHEHDHADDDHAAAEHSHDEEDHAAHATTQPCHIKFGKCTVQTSWLATVLEGPSPWGMCFADHDAALNDPEEWKCSALSISSKCLCHA
jgi:hypothetical protein